MAPNKLTLCHCAAFTHTHTCNTCRGGTVKRPRLSARPCVSRVLLPFFTRPACNNCVASAAQKMIQKKQRNQMQNAKKKNKKLCCTTGKSPDHHAHRVLMFSTAHTHPGLHPYSILSTLLQGLVVPWCTAAFKTVCQSFFHIIDCLLDYKPRGWASAISLSLLPLLSLTPSHFIFIFSLRFLMHGTCCMNGRLTRLLHASHVMC